MQSVKRPERKSLDWAASIAYGWDPESNVDPIFSFGNFTTDATDFEEELTQFIELTKQSEFRNLLEPIRGVKEPKVFPQVLTPIDEQMVVIDVSIQEQTGLHPKAALWQSGWQNASPYIVVRSGVFERLIIAVEILKTIDPQMYLCVTDGWRSIDQQRDLYNAFYPNGHQQGEPLYVSAPETDDRFCAPHPSGGAVDVLLGYKNHIIAIGSDLDHMDVQAHTSFYEHDIQNVFVRDLRRIFVNLLGQAGFVSIDSEWWHVEYGTRRWAGKKGKQPIYPNANVDESIYSNFEPVSAVAGSKRRFLETQ